MDIENIRQCECKACAILVKELEELEKLRGRVNVDTVNGFEKRMEISTNMCLIGLTIAKIKKLLKHGTFQEQRY